MVKEQRLTYFYIIQICRLVYTDARGLPGAGAHGQGAQEAQEELRKGQSFTHSLGQGWHTSFRVRTRRYSLTQKLYKILIPVQIVVL